MNFKHKNMKFIFDSANNNSFSFVKINIRGHTFMPSMKNDELCQAHQQKQTINLLFKNNRIGKHVHSKHFNVVSTLSFFFFYVATLSSQC